MDDTSVSDAIRTNGSEESAKPIESVRADMEAARRLGDYEAIEVLWSAFLKLANIMPGDEEFDRARNLVGRIDTSELRRLLADPAVDQLLGLNPPLETILANRYERRETESTHKELAMLRRYRTEEPRKAVGALGAILKRIRNKRVHGFKTRFGLRDSEILGAAVPLLRRLCELSLRVVEDDSMHRG